MTSGAGTMQYRVVVVTTKDSCCSSTFMNQEIESSCNAMAAQGFVLVNMYECHVQKCCERKHAMALIFVRP